MHELVQNNKTRTGQECPYGHKQDKTVKLIYILIEGHGFPYGCMQNSAKTYYEEYVTKA